MDSIKKEKMLVVGLFEKGYTRQGIIESTNIPASKVSTYLVESGYQSRLRRVSEEQENMIQISYLEGFNTNVIAEVFGLHNQTIKTHLRKKGVDFNDKVTLKEKYRMQELLDEGLSISEVARTLERSWSTVAKHTKEGGVENVD